MSVPFQPGTAGIAASHVELSISCRGLVGRDVLSKSDPMVVTFIQPFGERRWVEYHRTEFISNCHDPDFAAKVKIQYRFEEQQHLKFEVYDIDSNSSNLRDHDFLGVSQCTLGQIVSSGHAKLPLLPHPSAPGAMGHNNGFVLVMAEELSSSKDEVVLQFRGAKLDKKDFFGKSDPFLVFHKSTESGNFAVVHKTEVIKRTLDPKWKVFTISLAALCNGDKDRNLKVVCWDWNASGNHSLIGECSVTVRELSAGPGDTTKYTLIHPEKKKNKPDKYKDSGSLELVLYKEQQVSSFLDYIRGGTQIHCSIAIDFTGSNGDPLQQNSLHHISNRPNFYEKAIVSVGKIIEDYDTDKQFPVLGFGARIPPTGQVSHEFFVNMKHSDPYCSGINGVLEAYRACIRQIQLFGPTNFAPVINHVARFAASFTDGSNYFILLILTDGIITDMPQTVQAIVQASTLPYSIIIVGIGNADFSAMETLDADTVALQSGGRRAQRDIVQFVPFNKFLTGDVGNARNLLAREVLAEIPGQFISYMKLNGIVAKPPQTTVTLLPPDPELVISIS